MENIQLNHTTLPNTSPPLSLPAAPSKGCIREEYLPGCMSSCYRNSARRSTSATSAGSEGPRVIVIRHTCVSTRGCHCGTSHRARIIATLRSASVRLHRPCSSRTLNTFGLQEVCRRNHPVTALLIDRSWLVLVLHDGVVDGVRWCPKRRHGCSK